MGSPLSSCWFLDSVSIYKCTVTKLERTDDHRCKKNMKRKREVNASKYAQLWRFSRLDDKGFPHLCRLSEPINGEGFKHARNHPAWVAQVLLCHS